MYPVDEGVMVITRIQAFIPITDDEVNEAERQTFVVFMEIVETVNPRLVTITRTNSLCIIVDNDGETHYYGTSDNEPQSNQTY
jgi:hypothetical protein